TIAPSFCLTHHDARPFNFQPLSFTTYLPIHDSSLVYYRHKPSIPYSVYFLPNALLKRLSLNVKWRGNCYTRQLRRASHFLTSAALGSKVLTHTWKRFFLGSPCLSSRGF
ncbi:hypothetical protein BGY98DRAFT_1178416, partial [Russula aff. rugulosa BPL654]